MGRSPIVPNPNKHYQGSGKKASTIPPSGPAQKTGAAQRCRKWGEGSFGEIVQREPKTRLKSAATME